MKAKVGIFTQGLALHWANMQDTQLNNSNFLSQPPTRTRKKRVNDGRSCRTASGCVAELPDMKLGHSARLIVSFSLVVVVYDMVTPFGWI